VTMEMDGDDPKCSNYNVSTLQHGANSGSISNCGADLQQDFTKSPTLLKCNEKVPVAPFDSKLLNKNNKKRMAESQDCAEGVRGDSSSAGHSNASLPREHEKVASERKLDETLQKSDDHDASGCETPRDRKSRDQPPESNSITSVHPTEWAANVFGARSSFCGINAAISVPTFGSSGTSSPSSRASGFACLMSSNGDGLDVTPGFGSKLPSATRKTTVGISSYTFGLFSNPPPPPSGHALPPTSSSAILPDHVELTTGEEDELNLLAVRCKSYKWVLEEQEKLEARRAVPEQLTHNTVLSWETESQFSSRDTQASQVSHSRENNLSTHPSVPPSSNFNESTSGTKEVQPFLEATGASNRRWQELGIGPLRVLQKAIPSLVYKATEIATSSGNSSTASNGELDLPRCQHTSYQSRRVRLVQRRESAPNGPATKVILNVPLWKESTVTKSSERHVSLTTLSESGHGETFLFKFKTGGEAKVFCSKIADFIAITKSCVKETHCP
jgi:hypothetical protein